MKWFKKLRSKFLFWLLDSITHPTILPLTFRGAKEIGKGDIALIYGTDYDVGRVVDVIEHAETVHIRLYRYAK